MSSFWLAARVASKVPALTAMRSCPGSSAAVAESTDQPNEPRPKATDRRGRPINCFNRGNWPAESTEARTLVHRQRRVGQSRFAAIERTVSLVQLRLQLHSSCLRGCHGVGIISIMMARLEAMEYEW